MSDARGHTTPGKARLLLSLLLSVGTNRSEIARVFAQP
jgi:hypothetical protein